MPFKVKSKQMNTISSNCMFINSCNTKYPLIRCNIVSQTVNKVQAYTIGQEILLFMKQMKIYLIWRLLMICFITTMVIQITYNTVLLNITIKSCGTIFKLLWQAFNEQMSIQFLTRKIDNLQYQN